MLKRQNFIFLFLVIICLLFGYKGKAQNNISVSANNLPLTSILNTVSKEYNVRFAYNEDLFSQIQTTLNLTGVSIDQFLTNLSGKFGLNYKLIGGTYVIYIDDELKVIDAINTTLARNSQELKDDDLVVPDNVQPAFTLKGMVKNAKTGEKLNYCSLEIDSTIKTMTNEMGYFSAIIQPGQVIKIRINHLGFRQLDTLVAIQSTAALELPLHPIELIAPLKSIGFNRYKFIVSLPEVPEMVVFNPKSTLEVPALESNDLMNAITILPGINYLKGTETGLSIRGGAPSDNLVLIDGIPVIETSHLMSNLSVLNAKYIQQVFVSRGGFGAEYGGRTSGIVDLTGKSGNNDVAVVDFTANLLHTNIYVGLPITPKSSLSGSFKKSFVDVWPGYLIRNFALENKIIQADDVLVGSASVDQTIVNYADANLKLSIRPTIRKEITLNYFSSYDSQQRDYGFPIEGNYKQQNNSKGNTSGYSINYKSQNNAGWMNTFSIGFNRLESSSSNEYLKDAVVKDQLVKPFFDTDQIQLQELRGNWKSELKSRMVIQQFGVGFNYDKLNFRYEDFEIKMLGANNFNDSISARSSVQLLNSYYQMKFLPTKWLSLRGGVRGLYNANNNLFSFQPRYGIEVMPIPHLKFNYSGGRYLQHLYLAYRVDSYHNISSIWFIPTGDQEKLEAFHHIIGSRLELKKVLLNVEAYQKVNHNKIYFLSEDAVVNGIKTVAYQPNLGEEMNRGVDVFFQWQTSIFKHMISYSLSQSLEKMQVVNNNQYFPSIDDQLHRLRITEIISFKGWTASANWYYASGNPYLMNTSTSNVLNYGRLPNYRQLDVSLVKQFHFHNFFADIGLTVLNVANHKNEIAVKNLTIPEGTATHNISTTTVATSYSPLFYVNLRYE